MNFCKGRSDFVGKLLEKLIKYFRKCAELTEEIPSRVEEFVTFYVRNALTTAEKNIFQRVNLTH